MNREPLLEPFLVQFTSEIDLTAEQLDLHETKFTKVCDETTDDD